MNKIKRFIITTSFLVQFTGAKINTIVAAISLSIMISIKWQVPFLIAFLCVIICGGIIAAFIYYSGWLETEQKYIGTLLFKKEEKDENRFQ